MRVKSRSQFSNQQDLLKQWADLWLEWHVCSTGDGDLSSSNFDLVRRVDEGGGYQKVAIPVLALYHLAEQLSWLHVLRNSEHRPQDPYELVRFIQLLENHSEI